MKRPKAALPILAVLGAAALLAGAATAQLFRLKEQTLEHDGKVRRYLLYTPKRAGELPGRRPLVLVLHGGGGTHRGLVRSTKRRFHELADRDGFYVVYPNAIDRTWDFGEGEVSEALEKRVDDAGFFRKLLAHLKREHPIDPDRVFATGISRGGQASYFLACHFPGVIRAIAPVVMPLPAFLEDDCRVGPPVGVAVFNGTEDPLVPYGGGQIRLFNKNRGRVLSTDETLALWRKRNGCGGEPRVELLPDVDDDGVRVERSTWSDCEGAPVVNYRIEGGGHTWPSGGQYLPKRLIGGVSHDIDGAAEIWGFFREFEPIQGGDGWEAE